ncbi:MAG TPA: glycoside hydrolase family 2 TIM barrel-domain containing protein, partial [Sedimentisphaerales bacterium]|nr:glycoside hydrolase family 2 TIM barrel-domain containing protein [Sedimentisphaerales bacterium]
HESGYNEFEYEITDIAKPGEKAELKVEVYTYGKYLDFDNLDFWALAGIFRDVTLYARGQEHIEKWQYSTKWSDGKADVKIYGKINENIDGKVLVKLSFEGRKILEQNIDVKYGIFEDTIEVKQPRGWTAETPNLYDIELTLEKAGKTLDFISEQIGLREIKVAGPQLMINGRPIRIMGIARHDLWPDRGRAIGDDISKFDIEMMKKTGINAVRTAHHTPEKSFLKWADKLGIYVFDNIAMSNIEKQLNKPEYIEGTVLRTKETVNRDILHPSVICWVMGNENPMGFLHKPMYEEIHRLDQSRPALMPSYWGDNEFPKLNSIHYPMPYNLLQTLTDFPNRPMICTEYQHSAFDGIGGMEELWDVFDISPAGCGGTIWEWFDQGIKHKWYKSWQSIWPMQVTITPGDDTHNMPSGFGPGESVTPITININWDGDAGNYKLNLYVLPSDEPDRVEVSCDGIFAGVYRTKDEPMTISYPLKLQYKGKHNVIMIWDYVGGGHNFDSMELIDDQGRSVWQIGKKDNNASEFAEYPATEKMEIPRIDSVYNQGTDGMLGPNREIQDEYYNIRAVYAPIQIEQKFIDWINRKWTVDVENRYSFTDLKDQTQFVLQYYDGSDIIEKTIKGPKLKIDALSKKKIQLDISFIEGQKNLAAIAWQVPGRAEHCPDMLGQLWFNISDNPPMKELLVSEIQTTLQGDRLIVTASKVKIVFDKKAGALTSYTIGGNTLIQDVVNIGMWKPMLVHEQNFLYPGAYDKWGWDKKKFLDHQPDGEFTRCPGTMQYNKVGDRLVVTFINQYVLAGTEKELMRGFESYEIDSQGGILLKGCWWWQAADSQLRRIGFDFILPCSLDKMTFSGEGPWACYSDAKAGTNDSIHQLDRNDTRAGTNKTDCKWLRWSHGDTSLTLVPDWSADIQATVNMGATVQRISRTRGCGNKYSLPSPKDWVWFFNNQLIQMSVEIKGQ